MQPIKKRRTQGNPLWPSRSNLNLELRRFLLRLLRHLSVEFLRSFFDLLLGQVLGVSAEPPVVAIRIGKVSKAIAPEHVRHRHGHFAAGVDGALKSFVNILNIKIKAAAVPPRVCGDLQPMAGFSSVRKTMESPIFNSACPILPSGPAIRMSS